MYASKTPRAVFRNLGNRTFEELQEQAGPGVADAHCSRGCAFGDFDNDGDVDVLDRQPERAAVIAAQRRDGVRTLDQGEARRREVEPERHRRTRRRSRTAIGRRRRRWSANRASIPRTIRGCTSVSGRPRRVTIEIFWPSGRREVVQRVAANQLVTIARGRGDRAEQGWGKELT